MMYGSGMLGGDLFMPFDLEGRKIFLLSDDVNNDGSHPANDTPVANWKDKFKLNDATQSAGNQRPLVKTNSLNGKSTVWFNGLDDYLVSAWNMDYTVTPNLTIFCLYQLRSGGAADQALLGQDDLGFDRSVILAGSTGPGISDGTAIVSVTGLGTTNTWQLLTLQLQNGVTNGSQAWINGTSVATFTESHSSSGTSDFAIGQINRNAFYAQIDVAAFIGYDRVLTAQERQQVRDYIGSLYGRQFI